MTDTPSQDLYSGISGVHLDVDVFDLGYGVTLSKTYAHLMSPFIMAFAPPGTQGHHPAPWSAAKGGEGYDIHIQIHIPSSFNPSNWLNRDETAWWITALLRITEVPFASVTATSDMSFSEIPNSKHKPRIEPVETQRRIMGAPTRIIGSPKGSRKVISNETLIWVRENWFQSGEMMWRDSKFNTAFRAYDASTIQRKSSLALISLWGGIEQLFSPSAGELRFRVSALLASYLEDTGAERLKLYKKILKLYDARSTAAHTAGDTEERPLMETWILMRNALVKMLIANHVPSRDELEEYLFGVSAPPSWGHNDDEGDIGTGEPDSHFSIPEA